MTDTTPTRDEAVPTGWRYSINYGPEGEANYANVYAADGQFVGNLRTHHAIAVVKAMNAATSALENGPAGLADARTNPPLSDISSLRKGVEVVGEAAAYDFVAGWHERQAKLFREMADDDPRTAEPQRKRAFEAAIHHAASAAALRNRAADDRRAALVSGSREDGA